MDATAPVGQTVSALNAFQPRIVVGYASALRPLAREQHSGRLQIAPQCVFSASEVLSAAAAAEMTQAWGSAPFDVYAATETAGIASTCPAGRRHLYEDLVIVEPVDDAGTPVPAGTAGARLWVTVLFSRTLPLIRYELSDRVTTGGRGCPCGRPFGLLAAVEGRTEDVLDLPGLNGTAHIHPNVFHTVLDEVPLAQWQVIQHGGALQILLVAAGPAIDLERVRRSIEEALRGAGVTPIEVDVQQVDAIPRTALGKTALVRRT